MNDRQAIENQVECRVEKMVDRLDRDYMNGEFTETEYHAKLKEIDKWAEAEVNQRLQYAGFGSQSK